MIITNSRIYINDKGGIFSKPRKSRRFLGQITNVKEPIKEGMIVKISMADRVMGLITDK